MSLKNKNIMLVDDDDLLREVISDLLIDEGYNVLSFSSGMEAIEKFKKISCDIDLVLLDVVMPGLSGVEVIKIMKKINSEVKIIVMSGYTSKNLPEAIDTKEIIEFLHKPVSLSKLTNSIKKAM